MKAIILAAGKGSRLGKLTTETPKPMLPVNGKPILERIIDWLATNEIVDIGINLYTMPDKFLEYFENKHYNNVNLTFIKETELSGTAGAVAKFSDWIGHEDVFVVYGDILTDQDLKPLIDIHFKNQAFATLLMHRSKKSNSFIEVNANNQIIDFKERPDEKEMEQLIKKNKNGFLVNSAVQILSKKAIEYIKENKCFDIPKDVYVPNCRTEKLYGIELNGKRVAIDSEERYNLAKELFNGLE